MHQHLLLSSLLQVISSHYHLSYLCSSSAATMLHKKSHLSFVGFLIILVLLFPILTDANCHPDDRDSLLSFAANFSNLNWSATIDCCSWSGISCDDKGYRVVGLFIPKRGLRGAIPSSLRNLTSLSFINLSYNLLSGPLPDGFFSSLNSLHTVDLSYNRLSGCLPDTMPTTLRFLNFSSNSFSGTIQHANLQSLQSLIALNISNNSFTGTIPPFICNTSPDLVVLDFSLNDFSENIPQGFSACSNLNVLSLGFNNLTGQIPTDISVARSLQQLSLPGNLLTGEIGESITDLTNLRSLVMFGNMFSGSIPRNIGKLSLLEKLELYNNRLHGTLPQSLMDCTKLKVLKLRVNSLSGRLSDFNFSNFSQLSIIDLGDNQFSGVLPKTLFSCKSLTAIRLAGNKLEGEISPEMLKLRSLSFLSLSDNTFKNIVQAFSILSSHKKLTTLVLCRNFFNETLPAAGISGFQSLKIMGLGGCQLFGQFPTWLMSLTNLELFDLSQNNINGNIPGWLHKFPNLFYLDLSNNFLSGGFPVELAKLPALASQRALDQVYSNYLELPLFMAPKNASRFQYNYLAAFHPALYVANNNLSGEIPVEIGNMWLIHILDLSQNDFSGTIPSSISNLANLEKLDLSHNLLSGEIPSSLKSLHFLSSFNVADNNLQGMIPTGGQFDTFLDQSYEGNPGLILTGRHFDTYPELCGAPTQRSCSKRSDPSSLSSPGHKQDPDMIMILGPILGFCFGIGIIITCQTFSILSKRRILPRGIHKYVIWT